jgi:hypothetical protein
VAIFLLALAQWFRAYGTSSHGLHDLEIAEEVNDLPLRHPWLFHRQFHGSACGPVIVPVFKTGGRQAILSPVGSTPTRFRHYYLRVINSLDCGY